MSVSQTLLEEKHVRAMSFGRYLETHPDKDNPLLVELKRATCVYRMAMVNVLEDMKPKPVRRKKGGK